MKRLIIICFLALSISEVSEGIFRKKRSNNEVEPPGQNGKHKSPKCKWGRKGKHTTTTESPNWQYPCYPEDSIGSHEPSSISKEIDTYFGPILNHPDPDPPTSNCGLPYFPVGEECTCPSSHGNMKKPKSRRRRLFGCFGGKSSSEEGGGGYCPKHKPKPTSKGSKHKKGKSKKGKKGRDSNSYERQNEVY